MPISTDYRLCPNRLFLPVWMQGYQEVSETLSGFTLLVDQISVDKAFLDLSVCRRLFGGSGEIG